MKRRGVIALLVAGWIVLFALSFVLTKSTTPTGDGFTRGLNRVSVFFSWQALALVVAIVTWLTGLRQFAGSARWRWLSRLPVMGELVLVAFGVAVFGYFAWFNKPDATEANVPPTKPVTSPAQTLVPVAEPAIVPRLEPFQGVIHRVFETSHFYTLDGKGPVWLEASDPAWEKLNEYYAERPGRGSGILVIASFDGYRREGVTIPTLGSYDSSVFVERVDAARSITQEELELVLNQRRNEK
jgi:hypothetical protein